MKKAIVLLSGGLDSTTVLAYAKSKGYGIYALSFSYGQKNSLELECAKINASSCIAHKVIDIDLKQFGLSSLTTQIEVPINRDQKEIESDIPSTYVPCRNTIFLTYALALAESENLYDIFIGVNAVDYSGYPDCRPEYIKAFEKMANLATKHALDGKININTPLINLSKSEIIKLGTSLGVDYSSTLTCYRPNKEGISCGKCDSCLLRKKGFEDAGVKDPISYEL